MTGSNHGEGCYFCPEQNPAALEEHHLVPQRFGGSDVAENTVMLCGRCHNKLERLYDDGFYERLGVAVDQINNDRIEQQSGTQVEPQQSQDRELPAGSDHVQYEAWTTTVTVSAVREANQGQYDGEYSEFLEEHAEAILTEYDHGRESVRESWLQWEDEIDYWDTSKPPEVNFWFGHDSLRTVPHLRVRNHESNGVDYREMKESGHSLTQIQTDTSKAQTALLDPDEEYPNRYRLHCAYCHTVFSQYEHSDLARHLRVAHGIENPWEIEDTSFGESSESMSIVERDLF